MAQKIRKQSVVGSRQLFASVIMAAVALIAPSGLRGETVASKNNDGNRLFAKGRYVEAEKAYLEAQVKSPGKPEVLYNLGNALIKQKKYPQGLQSLRQSIDKGNKETQENSWYNTGNALYSMANFKESADAYIQALRLNPADNDAKHNLELALMKLQQEQQKQSGQNPKNQNSDKSKQDQASSGSEGQQQRPKQNGQNASGNRNNQDRPQQSQATRESQREGAMSKEQANQILDAVQNQELEQQRKLLESRARRKTNAKDW